MEIGSQISFNFTSKCGTADRIQFAAICQAIQIKFARLN